MPRKRQGLAPLLAVCCIVYGVGGSGWLGLGVVRAFIDAEGVADMLRHKTET